ncbi:glutaredoxin domain protein [Zymoseptoria brevis]|uniref:Glutaredoxin domain protein n=1 Tax=Zymoseptoria brevis TaxID=1047168 RepID=A0A0F4GCV9_9PEZI|nr:glutaredoxin domain protein [Zymoseptoria brevis]
MPSPRQYKALGFITLIALLTIYYISSGASSTQNSAFYQRTVESLNTANSNAAARQSVLEEERAHAERVERLRKEHDVATEQQQQQQKAAQVNADASAPEEKEKPVAGRRTTAKKDGKVVTHIPAEGDNGVAKVGNVEPKKSPAVHQSEVETEDEHAIEERLNSILKQGPIVVFSKSYCPHSKKAKNILQNVYTITPAPYVVELDQEPHGPALQDALLKLTGRRTVPNILINGKSIGGGDEVAALHAEGKLVSKVTSMGGKRVTGVVVNEKAAGQGGHVKREFKA